MSDDEGAEDYGDYEGIGGAAADEDGEFEAPDEGGPETAAEVEGDDELGLEEDAAGTDEDEEEGDEGADEEPDLIEPAGASQKGVPQREKVDPIVRASNKHRKLIIVADEDRETDNRLQTAEAALVISKRAEQIATHATHFALNASFHDPVAIAYQELFENRCPLILERKVSDPNPAGEVYVEHWVVREMTLPPLTPPVPLGAGHSPK
jgi:DNA-directed RNA polymerase subunit K/omega